MQTSNDVNYEELARSTDEFNGAQLKAVCVEAGMIALREGATRLTHEHFLSGISEGNRFYFYLFNSPNSIFISTKQEEEQPHVFCLDFLARLAYCFCHVFMFIIAVL
jgi:SpoVK/Ycf46/Vps4 family AAA+-type ATPase